MTNNKVCRYAHCRSDCPNVTPYHCCQTDPEKIEYQTFVDTSPDFSPTQPWKLPIK